MNYLLGLIPSHASYIAGITGYRRFGADGDVDLWATVRNDPQFGYMFVTAFNELDMWMPDSVTEDQLWRLFCFKRYRNRDDRASIEACALMHPKQIIYRTIIECFLMHPRIPFDAIAEVTGFTTEVISLFHEWFFNVRERTDKRDDGFILSLVYPASRQVEFTYNYHLNESWVHLAKCIAYNSGIESMFRWLGGRPLDSEITGVESMRAFESRVASGGKTVMEWGFQHQPNMIAISSTRQLLQASKLGGQESQDDDAQMGFGRLSMDQGAQLVIKQIAQGSAMEKLRAGQMLDESVAVANKKMMEERDRAEAIPV